MLVRRMFLLFVLLDSPRIAHIIHRMVETCFNPNLLIPRMHAVAYSCNQHANMNNIAFCLKDEMVRTCRRWQASPTTSDKTSRANT